LDDADVATEADGRKGVGVAVVAGRAVAVAAAGRAVPVAADGPGAWVRGAAGLTCGHRQPLGTFFRCSVLTMAVPHLTYVAGLAGFQKELGLGRARARGRKPDFFVCLVKPEPEPNLGTTYLKVFSIP
jgi:hypothetical protein